MCDLDLEAELSVLGEGARLLALGAVLERSIRGRPFIEENVG